MIVLCAFRSAKHKKKCTEPELALALNDIGLGSALEQILGDKQWVDDASGRQFRLAMETPY